MDNFDFLTAIPSNISNISFPTIPPIPGMQSIPGLNTLTRRSISKTTTPTNPNDLSMLAQKQKAVLPPEILIQILKYLPITSLPNFALACRRFKILVYDDELWEH